MWSGSERETMKSVLFVALASIGLACTPLAAQGVGAENVDSSEAMACSSLYTVLASAVEGDPEYDEFVDIAARWLVIASIRDGREDVSSEDELQEWVTSLLNELESQPDDEARESFLFEGIDVCEANYQLIADEFDSILVE